MEQVHEYENLIFDVLNEDMKMCEIFQELISHMRIEEANHLKDKMEALCLNSSKANLVESSSTVEKDRFKSK
ncbi:hypothetical protein KY285_010860 [Solanum tuberosum]|nr:hypothetical protein KY289_011431 [Solanum tuberosum]KAH0735153.1 hypothetical protein KY285_010860 [Solanum tuberosum]